MEGRIQKAREGRWNGGFAPYGYRLVDGVLQINEDEAPAIRTIFEQYVNTDTGANGLSKYLETHGFQKLARQNGTSPLFSATLIRAILKNPVYCGKIAFGRPKRGHRIGRIVERRTGQTVGAVQTIRTSQPQQDGTGAFIIRPCQVPHLRCWNV